MGINNRHRQKGGQGVRGSGGQGAGREGAPAGGGFPFIFGGVVAAVGWRFVELFSFVREEGW